ncbi:MAG: phage antirepressor Ant, partial [Oceanicoccus sp.]|uniref:BRO-N domain-containing protein n=1 Tax=Oceanicoccus sp. TaxID=2691044 RepID=UPI00261E9A59
MFNFEDANVRVINRDEEPWFVAKDVCEVLGIQNARQACAQLDEDEVCKTYVTDSLNREQETFTINESGLYALIVRSSKPSAKKFRRWVTGEVLPSIRKHGAYATPDVVEKALTDPDSMIKVLTALKQERKEKEKLIPKAAHSDLVCDSESLFTTTQIAKRLGT